jgi:hypothetical protein
VDHLPGDLWIHWIISRVYFALNPGSPFEAIPQYVFKLAPCAADLGIGLTLFLLARQMGHGSAGLVAAAIFTFNPASMFLTAIWGQWDAVATLFGLLALWLLLRGNVELSFPALAYAALVKPQYALLAPFFLLHFLFQADMWPVGRGHGSDDRRSWRVWRRSARRSLVALVLTMLVTISGGSQAVVAAEPEQRAGKLEHPEVVLRFLLPADQNPPTLR